MKAWTLALAALAGLGGQPLAAQMERVPDRPAGEGEGPFDRLLIRGATVIEGSGAPPAGPVDIVVEGNRIARKTRKCWTKISPFERLYG